MKHITLICCCALLLFSLVGCGGQKAQAIPLTEEETALLEAMGGDINAVEDQDYAAAVTELLAHPDAFSGQVYQLEGVYSTEKLNGTETPFVSRTLVHDGEQTQCGLPLRYLEKDLPDGAWVRVTAIINTGDFSGQPSAVMEVVAVEALEKAGAAQLDWDGVGHQH